MSKNNIISRTNEKRELENLLEREEASLVAVYGRRRVGKTFFINEFFDNQFTFKITGVYKKDTLYQLGNFQDELESHCPDIHISKIKTWSKAFSLLANYLRKLPESQKKIVFFDEMPWLDTPKSNFISAFEYFWNNHGCAIHNLVFIACGSSSMWINEHIVSEKGGLFNRKSLIIDLSPFSLRETELYLESIGIHFSRFDIAILYEVFGGLPYYLRFLDRTKTLTENVDALLFHENAPLKNEFALLFKTLFSSSNQYFEIVKALASKNKGLTRNEISSLTKIPNNGDLGKKLEDLKLSGFIREDVAVTPRHISVYQLVDFFSLFNLEYVYGKTNLNSNYFSIIHESPSFITYRGYKYELICLTHVNQIKESLQIGGILTNHYSWNYQDELGGAQIDLVIERNDKVDLICDAKCTRNEYVIDKEHYENFVNKIEVYRRATKNKKTILFILLASSGLKANQYSNIVSKTVTLDDLFR